MKALTHFKDWKQHENGTKVCVCSHPLNEHYTQLQSCSHVNCRCQQGRYPYTWRKRRWWRFVTKDK